MREKLIEILADLDCNTEYCADCEFCNDIDGCVRRQKEIIADRLIATGVTVQEWIPVTERLPEYHKEVLTRSKMGTSGHHYSVAKLWMIDDELGWVFDDGFEPQDIAEITHWMPLPEPPKEVCT